MSRPTNRHLPVLDDVIDAELVEDGQSLPVPQPFYPVFKKSTELGGYGDQWGNRMMMVARRRMKHARTARGMTQYQLAMATGLTVTAITNLESGRTRYPRLVTMERIAWALGVELKWLQDD